jgi:hypothetical protein
VAYTFENPSINLKLRPKIEANLQSKEKPASPQPGIAFDHWRLVLQTLLDALTPFTEARIAASEAIRLLELLTIFTDEIDRVTYERKTKQYYRLRHLDRIPLHTDYETIVTYICRLLTRQDLAERTSLVVDATGVGTPVFEMLRKRYPPAREILEVTITAGDQAKRLRHEMWTVLRRDLLYSVEYLLRNRLLQVATGTPHTRTLARELSLMERDFTPSGRETFEQSKATGARRPPLRDGPGLLASAIPASPHRRDHPTPSVS